MISSLLVTLPLLAQQTKPIEVPFRLAETAIIVDATINGKTVSCMFDTGFSGSFKLNEGINIGKATGSITLIDFVGSFQAPTVKINDLSFGPMKIDPAGMAAVQHGNNDYSLSYGMTVDGIMGLEPLRNTIMEINFERKMLIFHPKTHDLTKMVPDNKKTFKPEVLPVGNASVELMVETESGEYMVLALDTGNSFYATTHRDVLERIGIWKPGKNPVYTKTSWVASGPVQSWYLRMPKLKIYGAEVENSVWSIIDLPSSRATGDGTVGFGFLKHFNTTIDLQRRVVWMENWTGKFTEDPLASTGMSAFNDPSTKRMRVVSVTPGSSAEKAGIRRGDDVLSVDGKQVVGLTFDQFQTLMEGAKGSKVQVALSRSGNLMRVELERTVLVNSL
ncbi:MAG: PDZ domain-containing protein [Fimbriimonadaceae bacterium]|jgi:predicted aspartyl protease|nr:PDZ domain-containing protein [Fimbriimonadaceae bacterium]